MNTRREILDLKIILFPVFYLTGFERKIIIEREVCRLEASVIYIDLHQPLKYVIRKKTNIHRIMTYHVTFEYFLRILPEPTENVVDENLIVHRLTC